MIPLSGREHGALQVIELIAGPYDPDLEGAGGATPDRIAHGLQLTEDQTRETLARMRDRELIGSDASDDGGTDIFYYLRQQGAQALEERG